MGGSVRRDAGSRAVDEVLESEGLDGFSGVEILGPSEGIDVEVTRFFGGDVVICSGCGAGDLFAALEDVGDVFLGEVEAADAGEGEAFLLGFEELVGDGAGEGFGSQGFGGAGKAGGFFFGGGHIAGVGGGYDFVVGDFGAELESVALHWRFVSKCGCERCITCWRVR